VPGPLLATKLHVPQRRANGVSRRRLVDRLDDPVRLTLIAAPAGFGKTTLVTEWIAGIDSPVAWLSLDEGDDDAATFWSYLLTAIQNAAPGTATEALTLLGSGASAEDVLATLVNGLHRQSSVVVIVLDDLHAVENPVILSGLAFLIEALPSTARLVISSRTDPALPLGRLRARGDLAELRAAELRFTAAEASRYLTEAMGLEISAADADTLGGRTEGWIAALQLAAISLQSGEDPSAFVARFAGDDRFVVDYLIEEVMQRQPEALRTFLLETSILERLSAPLCDAVTETGGGSATLDRLDRANLFLVPLDTQRAWFRYHHLFAEMLRARLRDERPGRIPGLHLRASEWFEAHGDTAAAVGHALAAEAFDRAARLIKAASPEMHRQRQEVTLAAWFDALPADIVRADAELAIGYAGTLLSAGRTDGVDTLLGAAEATLGEASEGIIAVRRGAALYRAARALSTGDLPVAREQSARAVELAQGGAAIDRGSSAGLRGLVLWADGDLVGARLSWQTSLAELRAAGHLADALGGSIALGDILLALGRVRDAQELFTRALETAAASEPPLRGTADMHVGLAEVLRERGDPAGARRELEAAAALGEHAGLPQNRHRRRMALARLLMSEGDPAGAIPLLEGAQTLYTPDFFPEVRPIAALRARALLAAGRAAEAAEWASARRLSVDDDLTYLTEYDHITFARILLARAGEPTEALTLLRRLLPAAESGGRAGVALELHVLTALALQRARRSDEALDSLAAAVALAAAEGQVRVIADEGAPIAKLLAALARRDGVRPGLQLLLDAATGGRISPPVHELPDPLSDRELEVLRLLTSELSGPEIARHLVVSLNTVRTHTKSIYAKLGATSRREAVRRAAELGLVTA